MRQWLYDALKTFFQPLFELLNKYFYWFTPLGVIFAPLILLWSNLDNISAGMVSLTGTVNGAASWLAGSGVGSVFAQSNRLAPISESLGMLGLLLGLKVTCAGIRIIKSWIPTLS